MNEKKKQEIPMPFKFDDFFTTQEQRDEEAKEHIEEIDISLIDNFKDHPFKVIDNDDMKSLKESIKVSGVLSPVIVREKEDGRYEMISGHRRKYACESLGIDKIKCIIKNLSDDEATIFMVDSNLQREKLLPSEKAFAYKMKYEALKHQRKTPANQHDTEVRQVGAVVRSDDILGEEHGDSGRQVQRFIRLTYLIPELLNMVDNSELKESPSIALTPAVELSYLKPDEQKLLVEFINYNLATPSHAQAIELRNLSQKKLLVEETLDNVMNREKPNQILQFKIKEEKLFKVIPKNIERDKVEDFVLKACEYYSKHIRQKERDSR
ncbi:MAG: ParB/RepB/Spo0J family partition protein [Bacilli bacterium]|nr:ParB/RepB/Spo0J family partition protein [Bacilli bacterium]